MSTSEALAPTPRTSRELIAAVLGLRDVLRDHRRLFTGSTLLILGMHLCTGAVSALSAYAMSRIVTLHLEGISLWIALLGIAVVLLGVLTWLESWWSHVLAYRVLSSMRLAIHAAIGRIAPSGLSRRRSGEVAGAAVGDIEQLEWFYAHTAGATISALITPVIFITGTTVLIGPSGLLLLIGAAALVIPLWFLAPVQSRQGEKVRAELTALKSETLEGAQGLREVLTLGATDRYLGRITERSTLLQRAKTRFALRSGVETAFAEAVTAAATVTLLAILAAAVREGRIGPEFIPVAVTLVFHSYAPITSVYSMWQRLGELAAAARRVRTITEAISPISDEHATEEPFDAAGDIEFTTIDAGYDGSTVLENLSLTIPAGQTVALVGPSGAGKTTLAHLLVRFIDPTSGTIGIGGRDLSTVQADQVRQQIVLVPQTSYALRATLRENLLLAEPEASDEQIRSALFDAALDETLTTLEDGLDTAIGEAGGTLSGGQLQRLAIARALLRDPQVLILDEPVAHLDAHSEARLATSLRRSRAGRTTLIIAHRLSTIREADQVVYLDHGQIQATGTHHQLLRDSPRYQALLDIEADIGIQPGQG